jgi:hypothetical protein
MKMLYPRWGVEEDVGDEWERANIGVMSNGESPGAPVVPIGPVNESESAAAKAVAVRPTTLVLKGKTAADRAREPVLVADVRGADGVSFGVVLFTDDLARLPMGLALAARVSDGHGGFQLVPAAVRTDRTSDLGKVDITSTAIGDKSVLMLLQEVVRDPRLRRWLRPQRL